VAGETEAGLVYAGDVVAAGADVTEVPLPELLPSPAGLDVLDRAGFDTAVADTGSPSPP
jgi:hypothetical protein